MAKIQYGTTSSLSLPNANMFIDYISRYFAPDATQDAKTNSTVDPTSNSTYDLYLTEFFILSFWGQNMWSVGWNSKVGTTKFVFLVLISIKDIENMQEMCGRKPGYSHIVLNEVAQSYECFFRNKSVEWGLFPSNCA